MKIKLYSQYPQFNDFQKPKFIKWSDDGEIEAYHDIFISMALTNKDNNKKKIAIITEPRCVWYSCYNTNLYAFLQQHYNLFEYIFTFDKEILKLPNAKEMPFINVWDTNDLKKTKNISMCCSNKSMCKSHLIRKKAADTLKDKVDILGDYLNDRRATTKEIYAEYKYSVVLENEISDYYFTEKVLNAFSNKCIPIYYGSPTILKLFNKEGIIFVEKIEDIEEIIDKLDVADYEKHIDAVNENYEIVKNYKCYEDYLYLTYKDLLETL